MESCEIKANKNIFMTYAGLISSGYNLADESFHKEIFYLIRDIKFDEDVDSYFKKARTLSCKVNPYWPRAFLLTLSSLYLTEEPPYKYVDFDKLLNHIQSLHGINPNEKTEELFNWLMDLGVIITKLYDNIKLEDIWIKYTKFIDKNIEKYNLTCTQAFSLVKGILEVTEYEMPELIIIPNYLQAPQAADFAVIGNKIYIIKAIPDKESVIHELLHHFFDMRLDKCRHIINRYLFLLEPVLDEMKRYQYAWSYDEDSWNRVFEENFMRAASIWINYYDSIDNAREDTNIHRNYGFIYAPAILEQLFYHWNGLDNFEDFINTCLDACKNAV